MLRIDLVRWEILEMLSSELKYEDHQSVCGFNPLHIFNLRLGMR